MNNNITNSKEPVKAPEVAFLSTVTLKLKDRVIFPKKVEDAKKYLQKVKVAN